MILVLASVFFLNGLLNFISTKLNTSGSDHYYHLGLIRLIKKNRNRFISSWSNIIGHKNLSYPQLLHWILSFFEENRILKFSRYCGTLFSFLNLSGLLLIAWQYHDKFLIEVIELRVFILYIGLIYLFTPFNYVSWNAKNTGISARGLGTLLIQLYIANILFWSDFSEIYFVLLGLTITLIVILSSQIGFQYILLSSVFLSIALQNATIVLFPFLGVGLYFLLMPKTALNWVKGQLNHKYLYYKYLAKIFILPKRPSIWRDFIYDFWIIFFKNPIKGLWYLYNNPAVNIVRGFPYIIPLLYIYTVSEPYYLDSLYKILFVSILLFLLISFRKTRFLGEPERYVEFVAPFAILQFVILFHETYILNSVLILCIILTSIEYYISWNLLKRRRENKHEKINALLKEIHSIKSPVRLFSNNVELMKYFLPEMNMKVLYPNITALTTGPFHFKEIYKTKYPIVSKSAINSLIKWASINYFILDTSFDTESSEFEEPHFTMIKSIGIYKIYRIEN